ncbi:FAD dependent oxidoreductase family protein, partial [Vibrio cholerae HC-55C2]
MATETA